MDEFPFAIPDDVPITFLIPEEKLGKPINIELCATYERVAEYCNFSLYLKQEEIQMGLDHSKLLKENNATIESYIQDIYEQLEKGGGEAFGVPDQLIQVFKFLDITFAPVTPPVVMPNLAKP